MHLAKTMSEHGRQVGHSKGGKAPLWVLDAIRWIFVTFELVQASGLLLGQVQIWAINCLLKGLKVAQVSFGSGSVISQLTPQS